MGFFDQKQILVTGGAGFIGSHLVERLVAQGAKLIVIDSLREGCGGNLFNLKQSYQKIDFRVENLNHVSDFSFLKDVDLIFSLAGNCSHHDSMVDPFQDEQSNASSHLKLLDACRKKELKIPSVFAGTRQVYGPPQKLPVDETHPISPVDMNGIHKFSGESYHLLSARVYGMKSLSLRLTNTFGPHQIIHHPRQSFIGWFIKLALLGERIQLFGGGEQKRDFNYVSDVVDAFLLSAEALENAPEKCSGRAFNLAGEQASLKQVAELLINRSGHGTIESIPFPGERKKIDIGDYYGDSTLFESLTGWKPKVTLKQGIDLTLDFFEKHKEHYLPNLD